MDVGAEIVVLPPGHPYLGLPLQFATALEERLLSLGAADELEQLRKDRETECESRPLGHHLHALCSAGTSARDSATVNLCVDDEAR